MTGIQHALRCSGEAAAVLDALDFSAERPRAKPGRRLTLFRRTGRRHRLATVLPGAVRACLVVLFGILLPAVEARAQDSAADREALVALYNATGGPNWEDNTNWLSNRPLSEWHGVTVSNGRVTRLELSRNQLTGSIPSQLGNLLNLQRLYLRSNQLTGSIPSELGNLVNLRELKLEFNELTGSIPSQLGNVSALRELRIEVNQLTGSIPPELGNLTNLEVLNLDSNQLTGTMPAQLGDLVNLEELYLGSNQLTGIIPPELGNLTSVWMLSLEQNELTGPIPPQLGNLANLHTLRLFDNQLTGTMPPQLGNLVNLRWLSLSANQLTGPIPSQLENVAGLVGLYLHNNQLTGTIPQSFTRLEDLDYFFFFLNPGLCVQDASAIQTWLHGVDHVRGPDCAPAVRLSVNPSGLVEGDGATPVTVTATRMAVDSPTRVNLRGGGSAKWGTSEDYRLVTSSVSAPVIETDGSFVIANALTIPANRTRATTILTLTPVSDGLTEGDENLILEAVVGDKTEGSAVIILSDSGTTSATPDKPQPPTVAGATPHSLTVRWGAPQNTGPAITDYDVRYREVGSGAAFTDAHHAGTARTATLTGLIPDTDYEVQVRATNAEGTGAWSDSGLGRTQPLLTGDQVYYFPHLAVGASWQTTITYINYSSQSVTCRTDFISDPGGPLPVSFPGLGTVSSRSDRLPPGGSVHEETDAPLTAPLAPGWARAICSGPVKASLLFRAYRGGVPTGEAAVNAATVAGTRFVTFAEQGRGKAGTGVAYANPSDAAATITFMARDSAGQVRARKALTLGPGGHGAQNMASLFDLPGFTGSLEVTSTAPIVTLALNAEAAPVFSSLPPGDADAGSTGPTEYYFPHLAVGSSWQTTITYINHSSQPVTCQTDFVSDHGGPLRVSFPGLGNVSSRTDRLPPGGSVHEETDAGLADALSPGWARAACSGQVKASLLFRQYDSSGNPVAEAGVNAAAAPSSRFVTFAERAGGRFGTGVAYANPSATATASVFFTVRDAAGQTVAQEVRSLLPGGHDAQSIESLFGAIVFTGSLEVTSTAPIVSLSLNFEAAPVFSSLPPGEVP